MSDIKTKALWETLERVVEALGDVTALGAPEDAESAWAGYAALLAAATALLELTRDEVQPNPLCSSGKVLCAMCGQLGWAIGDLGDLPPGWDRLNTDLEEPICRDCVLAFRMGGCRRGNPARY